MHSAAAADYNQRIYYEQYPHRELAIPFDENRGAGRNPQGWLSVRSLISAVAGSAALAALFQSTTPRLKPQTIHSESVRRRERYRVAYRNTVHEHTDFCSPRPWRFGKLAKVRCCR